MHHKHNPPESCSRTKVGVFWDLESCHTPSGQRSISAASNLRYFATVKGKEVCDYINAYANNSLLQPLTRNNLRLSGISLQDVTSAKGTKNPVNMTMIHDMVEFAATNKKPPATLILISGDEDFESSLKRFREEGHKVVVFAISNRGYVPGDLYYAANEVYDWTQLAVHGDAVRLSPWTTGVNIPRISRMLPPISANLLLADEQLFKEISAAAAKLPMDCLPYYYDPLRRLPPQCVTAIQTYFIETKNDGPIQPPYTVLQLFVELHCGPEQNQTFKSEFGYHEFSDLLMDAQAAGLLYLHPSQTMSDNMGRPCIEVCRIECDWRCPSEHPMRINPCSVLYWLALGFRYAVSQAFRKMAFYSDFRNVIVKTLASNSPHYDRDLHSKWYFARAWEKAWVVREAMKKRRENELSPKMPPTVSWSAAVTELWRDQPSKVVVYPFAELERHIQSRCGRLQELGFSNFIELILAAQTAGLLWMRGEPVNGDDSEEAHPVRAELVQATGEIFDDPLHVMFWLVLGFTHEEAHACMQKVSVNDWKDTVVAKLASNSPAYDWKLRSQWHSHVQSEMRKKIRNSAAMMIASPTTSSPSSTAYIRSPSYGHETGDAISARQTSGADPCHAEYWTALGFSLKEAQGFTGKVSNNDWSCTAVAMLARGSGMYDEKLHALWQESATDKPNAAVDIVFHSGRQPLPPVSQPAVTEELIHAGVSGDERMRVQYSREKLLVMRKFPDETSNIITNIPPELRAHAPISKLTQEADTDSNVSTPRFPDCCKVAIFDFWAFTYSASIKSPFAELEHHIRAHCGDHEDFGYGSFFDLLYAAQTAGALWLRTLGTNGGGASAFSPGGPLAVEAVNVEAETLANPWHAMYWLILGFSEEEARAHADKAKGGTYWEGDLVAELANDSPFFNSDRHAQLLYDTQYIIETPPAQSDHADDSSKLPTADDVVAQPNKEEPNLCVSNEFELLADCSPGNTDGVETIGAVVDSSGSEDETSGCTDPRQESYWRLLGFCGEQAKACAQKAIDEVWEDEVVAELANSSPLYDAKLHHARLYIVRYCS